MKQNKALCCKQAYTTHIIRTEYYVVILDVAVVELFHPRYYVLDSLAGSHWCRSLKKFWNLVG